MSVTATTVVIADSRTSDRGLDGVNFFVAAAQTGFGALIAVYLAERAWSPGEIGFALSIGTIASMLSQLPAGAAVDAIRDKRRAVLFGIAGLGACALLFAVQPSRLSIYFAEMLHGFASSVLSLGTAAVTLRLVGRAAFGERVGRNARFASLGNGLAAGAMGAAGSYVSADAVFWLTAILCVPAWLALRMIGAPRAPVAGLASVADAVPPRLSWDELKALLLERQLLIFAACVTLFFLANAAMLPLAASAVARRAPHLADVLVAATIMVPTVVVALLAPWVGRSADGRGRRPMMLLGWFMLPVQGLLYGIIPDPFVIVLGQAVSGISAAVFGVIMPLVAADLTRKSGRFNLLMGALGCAMALGAAVSTTLGGVIVDAFGDRAAFLCLAGIGMAGALLLLLAMPETGKPRVPVHGLATR